MSDLLEDQRIHYIVKDYRRMYNGYWSLKAIIEELQKSLREKDGEIIILRSKINELKDSPSQNYQPPKEIKGLLCDAKNQVRATINKLDKRKSALTKTEESLKKIEDLIYKQ